MTFRAALNRFLLLRCMGLKQHVKKSQIRKTVREIGRKLAEKNIKTSEPLEAPPEKHGKCTQARQIKGSSEARGIYILRGLPKLSDMSSQSGMQIAWLIDIPYDFLSLRVPWTCQKKSSPIWGEDRNLPQENQRTRSKFNSKWIWLVYLQFRGTREKLQGGVLDLFTLIFNQFSVNFLDDLSAKNR